MWMKVALTVASRAEISEYAKEKPNVGCVIRRSRSKGPPAVLAVGWNGFPPKTSEDILKEKATEYDRTGKKHRLTKELGLHAEANALRNCSENPEKATVYVTHVPCHDCAKQLVSHRVKRVFYLFWMDNCESSIESYFRSLTFLACLSLAKVAMMYYGISARLFLMIITFVWEAPNKTYPRKVHSILALKIQ